MFGPYLLGVAALIQHGVILNSLWQIIVLGIYFTLPANLLIYGVNDIFDFETDQHNVKKQGYEQLVPIDQHRWLAQAIVLINLPFLIASIFILPGPSLVGLLTFVALGVGYSAPPRFKTVPFLDALSNILYIMPALVSFGFLGYPPVSVFVAGCCWAMAMHAFSAIPDITADRTAGMRTIATTLGAYGTVVFCRLLYIVAAIFALEALGVVMTAALLVVYLGITQFVVWKATEEQARKVYRYFPMVNTLCGLALTLIILFHISL